MAYAIFFQSKVQDDDIHVVLGGPYEKEDAEILMARLSSVHTDDDYWIEEVA